MEWPFDRFDELTTGKLMVYAALRGGGADSRNSGTQAACPWGGIHCFCSCICGRSPDLDRECVRFFHSVLFLPFCEFCQKNPREL